MGSPFGVTGRVIGAVIGFILALSSFIMGRHLILQVSDVYFPDQPRCKNGRCGPNEYERLQWTEKGCILQCSCGDKYFDNIDEWRFMRILEDGSLKPYMRQKWYWRTWQEDDLPPIDSMGKLLGNPISDSEQHT